jgi:sugar phosphate isomerase/epimerase
MTIGISNIAWSREEDEAFYELLREEGVRWLEIAPKRIWDEPEAVPESTVRAWAEGLRERRIEVRSFQAILFGRPELELFSAPERRSDLMDYLRKMVELASWCGARPLVFGSPKNRLRGDLSPELALKIAAPFFRELGDFAASRNCAFVMEANPPGYGCDFVTTLEEMRTLVSAVDSPGFLSHLDLGGVEMAGESLDGAPPAFFVAHVHLSRPYLAPVDDGGEELAAQLAGKLRENRYNGGVVIEMKRPDSPHQKAREALSVARRLFAP